MGSRYLTDLDDVCRNAGLHTILVDGWEYRARSSGGYEGGRPTAIMVHHTASGPSSDGWPDVNYMCYSSDNRPVANLYLNRGGSVWVMAGGCTNTNGKGHDYWGGGVPDDSMNSYAIGIEAGNGGTGEPWPQAQQDSYVRLCQGLRDHYGISNNNIRAHHEWAPDRKVDPFGPAQWGPGEWIMDAYRQSCAGGGPGLGKGMEDVAVLLRSNSGDNAQRAATFAWNGVTLSWITSDTQISVGAITGIFINGGQILTNFSQGELQDLIDRTWSGGPVPPGYRAPKYANTGS